MSHNFVEDTEFVVLACGGCHVQFAMTQEMYDRRRRDHKRFYCPNGCCRVFTGKTEEQKLREQLDTVQRNFEAQAGRAAALQEQRDQIARAHRKMRDRIKNGVCPCCNRTFQNFLQHMRTEHPEFGDHSKLRILRDLYGLTQSAVADEAKVSANHVSLYERGKPVAGYAQRALDRWIATNGEAE